MKSDTSGFFNLILSRSFNQRQMRSHQGRGRDTGRLPQTVKRPFRALREQQVADGQPRIANRKAAEGGTKPNHAPSGVNGSTTASTTTTTEVVMRRDAGGSSADCAACAARR